MPGEERGYTSRLWAGKRTEAEVLANAREAFKGLSLRIDNVWKQYELLTGDKRAAAEAWSKDIKSLITWRDLLNKYMGDGSFKSHFDRGKVQQILHMSESRGTMENFLKSGAAYVHTTTALLWVNQWRLFGELITEFIKIGTPEQDNKMDIDEGSPEKDNKIALKSIKVKTKQALAKLKAAKPKKSTKLKAEKTNKSLTTAQANLAVLADMRRSLGR